jgi:1-acyl-sn-glycerol-3-phosphate acyltransferase
MEFFFDKRKPKKREHQHLQRLMLDIVRKYFRLEVEGLDNIPRKGSALIVPNHSGVTALDAVMIGNEVFREKKRIVRILAHPLWFIGPNLRVLARRIGLEEADKDKGIKLLKKGNLILIFPEGAEGNFKPTAKRYHLQDFKRGFVRMAITTKTPIIPTVVIGAEETNINLSSISVSKYLKGTVIPLPLNMLPLPAKWKIIFLKPISLKKYSMKDLADSDLMNKIASEVRDLIQHRIDEELKNRDWIYFPKKTKNKN